MTKEELYRIKRIEQLEMVLPYINYRVIYRKVFNELETLKAAARKDG